MTLEQLSSIGQLIAAVAVIFSLAAVYLQVRQTNRIARVELTHSVWLQGGQMNLSLYDTPEKAELMHRALYGTGPLSGAEKLRMRSVISIALGIGEAAFTLRKRGLIEGGTYKSFEATTQAYLRTAIVQQWWAESRSQGKDPAYVALLDGFVAQINPRSPSRTGEAALT